MKVVGKVSLLQYSVTLEISRYFSGGPVKEDPFQLPTIPVLSPVKVIVSQSEPTIPTRTDLFVTVRIIVT